MKYLIRKLEEIEKEHADFFEESGKRLTEYNGGGGSITPESLSIVSYLVK